MRGIRWQQGCHRGCIKERDNGFTCALRGGTCDFMACMRAATHWGETAAGRSANRAHGRKRQRNVVQRHMRVR